MKSGYDRLANTEGFREGQLVLICNPKLQTSWEGPYKVIKLLNDIAYRTQKANSPEQKCKSKHRSGQVGEVALII